MALTKEQASRMMKVKKTLDDTLVSCNVCIKENNLAKLTTNLEVMKSYIQELYYLGCVEQLTLFP